MPAKGHEEFIEHVCEPFKEDDEMALVAKDRISRIVNESDADLEEANRALESGCLGSKKKRILFTLSLLIFSACLIVFHFRSIDSLGVFSTSRVFSSWELEPIADQYSHLNDEERFILFGSPNSKTQLEVAESRWRAYPNNASYYIEYALESHSLKEIYPENLVEYGDEIDSENSLYRMCVAVAIANEEVVIDENKIDPFENETWEERRERRMREREDRRSSGSSASGKKSKEPTQPQLVIVDEKRFDEALELLYEAAKKPEFNEYMSDLMKERVPLLNTKRETLDNYMIPILYIIQMKTAMLKVLKSSEIIIAEAQRCGKNKDVEALKSLAKMHEDLSKQFTNKENVSLVHALVARAFIHKVLPHLQDAFAACDLPEDEKKYASIFDDFEKEKALREAGFSSMPAFDWQKESSRIASIMSPLVMNKIKDQSVIQPVNHEPLRIVEHSIFSKIAVICGCLICIILAFVFWVSNQCKNKLTKMISGKLLGVLGVKDWMFVLLVGIVLPTLIFIMIDRYSPWKITDYSILYSGGIHTLFRVLTLLLLLFCCQVLVMEWRLAKVTQSVFGKQSVWLVWAALILAIAPVFMLDLAADSSDPLIWYASLGVSAFLLVTLIFVRFLPGLFSYKNSVVSRGIVLSLLMTATVLALLLPVYKAEERYWISNDEIMKLSPDRVGFPSIEGEVANQFMKETRKLTWW